MSLPPEPCSSSLRILVTAGPTREPIDAVRDLGNRSSGRMGRAIATAFARRGATVTLLAGPGALPVGECPAEDREDSRWRVERFRSTEDLARLLAVEWPRHDVLVMAAAVADYRPKQADLATKLPRGEGELLLRLEPTPDLLASCAASARPEQLLIGFALEEPERLAERAGAKLRRKRIDGVVANPLRTMDAETVSALLLLADGRVLEPPQPEMTKEDFGAWLVERLLELAPAPPRHAAP